MYRRRCVQTEKALAALHKSDVQSPSASSITGSVSHPEKALAALLDVRLPSAKLNSGSMSSPSKTASTSAKTVTPTKTSSKATVTSAKATAASSDVIATTQNLINTFTQETVSALKKFTTVSKLTAASAASLSAVSRPTSKKASASNLNVPSACPDLSSSRLFGKAGNRKPLPVHHIESSDEDDDKIEKHHSARYRLCSFNCPYVID